jgi:hypothetical protein
LKPKHQAKQNRARGCPFEVSTLRYIVVGKHEYFNSSTAVRFGKRFETLEKVLKFSSIGGFCLVKFFPRSRLPFHSTIQKYDAPKSLSTGISKTITYLKSVLGSNGSFRGGPMGQSMPRGPSNFVLGEAQA